MRTRIWLGLFFFAAMTAAQPAAQASRPPRSAPVKKLVVPRGSAATRPLLRRGKPGWNGFKRRATPEAAGKAVAAKAKLAQARAGRPRPSIARNVGWGAFFATLGTASAMNGSVLGALIGAGATAYNALKGWLIGRRGASAAQAGSIAFNAGWGTFWGGVGVHGVATGNPLAAAIGLGAGAYNLFKAGRNARALPGSAE